MGIDDVKKFDARGIKLIATSLLCLSLVTCRHRDLRQDQACQGHLRYASDRLFCTFAYHLDEQPYRPYIKGLPITATVLSTHPNGDYSEEYIRREERRGYVRMSADAADYSLRSHASALACNTLGHC